MTGLRGGSRAAAGCAAATVDLSLPTDEVESAAVPSTRCAASRRWDRVSSRSRLISLRRLQRMGWEVRQGTARESTRGLRMRHTHDRVESMSIVFSETRAAVRLP